MKILTNPRAIREALHQLKPHSVAVAYVGKDWEKYVSVKHLKQVVLSPTFGSNPTAIDEMMRCLGDENVHFLDKLHSKIYLGTDAAIVGSCNLSNNAMGDDNLLETAVVLRREAALQTLAAQFAQYKKKAKEKYPKEAQKLERLRELKAQWDKAEMAGVINTDGSKSPPIEDYQKSRLDRIHVAWYESTDLEYDTDKVHSEAPESANCEPDDYFSEAMDFREEDDVREGDWILAWRCRSDGLPRKDGAVEWMQVHHVISGGSKDRKYPKVAGEAVSKFRKRGLPPFRLDKRTKALVRDTLETLQFPDLLSTDESTWSLGPADKVTPAFIDALRRASRSGGHGPRVDYAT